MFRTLALCVALVSPVFANAQGEPIRIGFLTVRTGPLAAGGKQMEQGIHLSEGAQHKIAGRKVGLIIGDTGANRSTRDYLRPRTTSSEVR